ncbi:MAG: aconitate hydratase [Clostridia bacterium]|nr:aconitate hydratase [Clostridia bacterium]MDH7573211.1 aconitate hydratase [Clostridia bacterium]
MGLTLAEKIITEHLVAGKPEPGEEIGIRIDQTLTQDATGTMAYLQFEALGLPRVRVDLAVSYVDHNTLQTGFENADDHLFLQTVAAKYGICFSRPGNGICHQVHLERFGVPGKTLLGSDSHTPTAGGLGMLAIGAGGLDVAVAMAGGPFYLSMPRIVLVHLEGQLPPWVTAKDVILTLLGRLSVKGGVGKILEYGGPGAATLTVPQRATICNMGAELGATSSLFPSDDQTLAFLSAQRRAEAYRPLAADPDARYGEVVRLNLAELEPMAARPHSPDAVAPVREVGPVPVDQVAIGSCTNSSYPDLMRVAAVLKGKTVHPRVSLVIAPGSRQVLRLLAANGGLETLLAAGARILEPACGPCIGMGQAPASGGVSLRTFNRNFRGRSGTADAQVYLVSPEVAAASALTGVLTDPRELGPYPEVEAPPEIPEEDNLVLPPAPDPEAVEIRRGPNIAPLPLARPLPERLEAEVLLKLGDNISTDDILPAGSKILPLRSNIPAISAYVFAGLDPGFAERARAAGGGIVVAGQNYGQGSSREHAALAPMYLGIKAVLARSFARIHRANLINFGLLPLLLVREEDYEAIRPGDRLVFEDLRQQLAGGRVLRLQNLTQGREILVRHDLSPRETAVVLAGGLLNYVRDMNP